VQYQVTGLVVEQKDLPRVLADDFQRGLKCASQDLVQVLGAVDLGSDAGQGG
jgi:hypothetical protein